MKFTKNNILCRLSCYFSRCTFLKNKTKRCTTFVLLLTQKTDYAKKVKTTEQLVLTYINYVKPKVDYDYSETSLAESIFLYLFRVFCSFLVIIIHYIIKRCQFFRYDKSNFCLFFRPMHVFIRKLLGPELKLS